MKVKPKLSRRKVLFLDTLRRLGGVATTREIAQKTSLHPNGISQTLGGINNHSHVPLVSCDNYFRGHVLWRLMPAGIELLKTNQTQIIFGALGSMRLIVGYLVVCEGVDARILFGPVESFSGEGIENFETNGLKVFDSFDEAKTRKKFLYPKNFGYPDAKAKIALVKILVAENQSGFNQLKLDDPGAYIVIHGYGDCTVQLIGSCHQDVSKLRLFDSGGLLYGRAEPFSKLADAECLSREAVRQSATNTVVAYYYLEFVD